MRPRSSRGPDGQANAARITHGYVWSLFAAGHDIYASTPAQVEMVKEPWELAGETGRATDRIEVRFHTRSAAKALSYLPN